MPGILLIWIMVGKGLNVLAVAGGGVVHIQSNLDYSKCQGPPDFLRIIDSSNFRNRYFSEMFHCFVRY